MAAVPFIDAGDLPPLTGSTRDRPLLARRPGTENGARSPDYKRAPAAWAEAQEGQTSQMSDYPVVRGSRSGDPHPRLRLAALAAVITGVLLVAAAAFLLSYNGIHQIALQAGVSPTLARLYPVMFDAMLVIACSSALALRGAGWPTRLYVWLSLLVLLGAVAAADALYATTTSLPVQPTQAVVAVVPWALLLMSFIMLLLMLRYWRRIRAANGTGGAATGQAPAAADGAEGRAGPASAASLTWAAAGRAGAGSTGPARAGAPRAAIDTLLEPRTQRPPERTAPLAARAAAKEGAAGGTSTGDKTAGQATTGSPATTAGPPTTGSPATTGGVPEQGRGTPPDNGTRGGISYEAPASGAGASAGTPMHETAGTSQPDTEDAQDTGDRASPPPMVPAPTPIPHFDRMRSTPTPPQEPAAGEE